MSVSAVFLTDQPETFRLKALYWADSFDTACYFDSNHYPDPYSVFDVFIATGSKESIGSDGYDTFASLDAFIEGKQTFIPGYFAYDLKNELEGLQSANEDHLGFPDLHFFIPETTILLNGNEVRILAEQPEVIWNIINSTIIPQPAAGETVEIKTRFNKAEYKEAVKNIIDHIRRGDIYEMNFCQEFYAEQAEINPLEVFLRLNTLSPTPFSGYLKSGSHFIISASPERFLSRRGEKLISQPIKGTYARHPDRKHDAGRKESLRSDEKELTENVMIVDLVRNDLTKSAKPGTVKVEELFGVYSFAQVHQLISTIVCEKQDGLTNGRVIANTFPMGSMTGTPKIKAMIIAEKYEKSKRGAYSGALGYFAPNGDFDFNVIIRSLLYNRANKYLSFHAGGAITIDSDPDKEYEECILKAKAITEVLSC